jgi:alanine racemase
MEPLAAEHCLIPFVQTAEQLRGWERQAESQGAGLACHLEIDSGMTRTGLSFESARELAELIALAPNVSIEGIATHLASAENFTDPLAEEQIRCFAALVCQLADLGIRPRFIHHANSAAIAYGRLTGTNLVRPGLSLFGYVNPPVGQKMVPRLELEPALEWAAKIVAVRDVAAGAVLGYNATYRADRPMRVGVVSVGYADGLDRRMSNGGVMLVGEAECPIAGLISMDVTLIDLSNAPHAVAGDEVTLLGKQRDAWRMAERCGTIPYEILCGISKRVPRVYA